MYKLYLDETLRNGSADSGYRIATRFEPVPMRPATVRLVGEYASVKEAANALARQNAMYLSGDGYDDM